MIGKDLEGGNCGLNEVRFCHLTGGTEENTAEKPLFLPGFKVDTFEYKYRIGARAAHQPARFFRCDSRYGCIVKSKYLIVIEVPKLQLNSLF